MNKKQRVKKDPMHTILKLEAEKLRQSYSEIDDLSDKDATAYQEKIMEDGIILTIGICKDEDGRFIAREILRENSVFEEGATMAEAVEPILWKHIYHRMAVDHYVTRNIQESKNAVRTD